MGADHHGFDDGRVYLPVCLPNDNEIGPRPAGLIAFRNDIPFLYQSVERFRPVQIILNKPAVGIIVFYRYQGDGILEVCIAQAEGGRQVEGPAFDAAVNVRVNRHIDGLARGKSDVFSSSSSLKYRHPGTS